MDNLDLIDAPPTRGNAKLDETACSFASYISECTVKPPLETEGGSTRSDHGVVLIVAQLPLVHHFTKRKFEYRPITNKGKEEFKRLVTLFDWSAIHKPTPSESAAALENVLNEFVCTCFPVKEKTVKSTDSAWISGR